MMSPSFTLTINGEKYIPYEYLAKAFDFFATKKNEFDKESIRELSDKLLSILTNLVFNSSVNNLKFYHEN